MRGIVSVAAVFGLASVGLSFEDSTQPTSSPSTSLAHGDFVRDVKAVEKALARIEQEERDARKPADLKPPDRNAVIVDKRTRKPEPDTQPVPRAKLNEDIGRRLREDDPYTLVTAREYSLIADVDQIELTDEGYALRVHVAVFSRPGREYFSEGEFKDLHVYHERLSRVNKDFKNDEERRKREREKYDELIKGLNDQVAARKHTSENPPIVLTIGKNVQNFDHEKVAAKPRIAVTFRVERVNVGEWTWHEPLNYHVGSFEGTAIAVGP